MSHAIFRGKAGFGLAQLRRQGPDLVQHRLDLLLVVLDLWRQGPVYSKLPKRRRHDTPTSWLDAKFPPKAPVTFVQIGAFDGIDGDLIRSLILSHPGWRGVLIEPMPVAFERLKENYASQSHRLHLLNCVVSNRSGNLEMYEVDEEELQKSEFPSWVRQVASVSEAHVKKHFPSAKTRKRTVHAMRISDVVRICNLSKIDLLVMDVEGHERNIIEDVEFHLLGVRAILFEHKHMTAKDEDAVFDYLKSFGFTLRRFEDDAVAYR